MHYNKDYRDFSAYWYRCKYYWWLQRLISCKKSNQNIRYKNYWYIWRWIILPAQARCSLCPHKAKVWCPHQRCSFQGSTLLMGEMCSHVDGINCLEDRSKTCSFRFTHVPVGKNRIDRGPKDGDALQLMTSECSGIFVLKNWTSNSKVSLFIWKYQQKDNRNHNNSWVA